MVQRVGENLHAAIQLQIEELAPYVREALILELESRFPIIDWQSRIDAGIQFGRFGIHVDVSPVLASRLVSQSEARRQSSRREWGRIGSYIRRRTGGPGFVRVRAHQRRSQPDIEIPGFTLTSPVIARELNKSYWLGPSAGDLDAFTSAYKPSRRINIPLDETVAPIVEEVLREVTRQYS